MEKQWQVITTLEQLNELAEGLMAASVIGVDTETTGLDPHADRVRLLQLAVADRPTILVDCFKVLPQGQRVLSDLLTGKNVKIFQNAKFDLQFLKAAGVEVEGPLFDTMLAGLLLRSSGGVKRVGLAALVDHYLGEVMSKEAQTSDFSGDLTEDQLAYAALDAEVLLRLRQVMVTALKKNQLVEVARLEFACVYAVASMEYAGIHLDMKLWQRLTTEIEKERDQALEHLYPYVGYPTVQLGLFETSVTEAFNFNSNKQVLALLKKNGIHVEGTSRGALAGYLDHPLVKEMLLYRHAMKVLTTFLYPLPDMIHPKTGRLHPHYGQSGAYSGRMSCGNPNIQQIPRELAFRSCFTAPKGRKLVIADYSQIELRVIAQYTGDQRMIQAYKKGEDLHKLTASLILQKPLNTITKEERQAAKAVNFGLVFGMGGQGLKAYAADTYGSQMTLEEAELFRDRYFKAYQGVATWHGRIKRTLPGESRTLSGRKHVYRPDAPMAGRYNTPIQGTAADILKNALGKLYLAIKDQDTYIVAVVHDEIVLECPEDKAHAMAELLATTMEEAGARYMKDVPTLAEASISDSWAGKA